ncbi:MAG: hypothetical protein ACKVOJ_03790 [Sphingomonadaceae bacterium]
MRVALLFVAALAPIGIAVPAVAEKPLITIFPGDPCPAGNICVVGNERDRYRIPKLLRETKPSPQSTSWAVRQQATLATGKSGQGSCSTAGSGGWTGCWKEYMDAARAEAKARKAETADAEAKISGK